MEPTLHTEENTKTKSSFFRELVVFAGISMLIILPIRFYIAQPFLVSGASMEPTFRTGEYLIVDQITYKFQEPERGDVIILRFPQDPSKFFIKRVIGLPNETVVLNGEGVHVITEEGERIDISERYVSDKNIHRTNAVTELESDEYFVMGDNRMASADSRTWGPLKRELVVGRAFLRLFPVSEIDFLPGSIE